MLENRFSGISTVLLSIILPVYSEEKVLVWIVDKLEKLMEDRLHEIILVVSPRSSERSVAICKNLAGTRERVRFIFQKNNPGLGRAIREGLKLVSGTHVLLMDSDGEMSPMDVPRLIARMEQSGCDMVVGCRWMKGGGVVGYDPVKYLFNRAFQLLFKIMFLTKLHDLTLGFKIMRRIIVDSMDFRSDFHDIAIETTLKPLKSGFKVEEIPVIWRCRQAGVSKNSILSNLRYLIRGLNVRLQ